MSLVRDLSESELLARLADVLPRGPRTSVPTGDDCMVLDPSDGRVCVTTDVLVEGRHFRRDWSSAEQIGRRAVAQNLADVAAMGAVPLSIVVGLVLPGDIDAEWAIGLGRGLGEACREAGAGVDGGDLSSGDAVVVAVTAFGDLQGRAPVVRSGARPGDVVVHCGDLGRSAAGLALQGAAESGRTGREVPGGEVAEWARAGYRVPVPPLAAGPQVAAQGATAMMDVSDGLLRDAGRIAAASGVVIDLHVEGRIAAARERLAPLEAVLRGGAGKSGAAGADWADEAAEADGMPAFDELTAVLTGGEDHGLLATLPAGTPVPNGWAEIGVVREAAGSGGGAVTVDGMAPKDLGVRGIGWDHFGS